MDSVTIWHSVVYEKDIKLIKITGEARLTFFLCTLLGITLHKRQNQEGGVPLYIRNDSEDYIVPVQRWTNDKFITRPPSPTAKQVNAPVCSPVQCLAVWKLNRLKQSYCALVSALIQSKEKEWLYEAGTSAHCVVVGQVKHGCIAKCFAKVSICYYWTVFWSLSASFENMFFFVQTHL